jgi:polysaccharide deacetylase family protein (PEP-CTERM system associated)
MKILTFDIEEWFHLLDNKSTRTENDWLKYESRIHANMERIFKLLEDTQQKATFFCLGWVAQKYPEVIKRIDDAGYEIGTHSDMHQLVYEQSATEFEIDLERSVKSIEDITGKKVTAYRAPGFSIKEDNDWAFEILLKNGITTDSSVFPAARSHGGFPDFGISKPCLIDIKGNRLMEFPINLKFFTKKIPFIFSGGGYFRLLPEFLIKKYFNEADYVMTYFHPRDFDAEQPVIQNLSKFRRFKSYYGLNSCFSKLEALLKEQEFVDIRTAVEMINWDNTEIKKIK